MKLTTEDIVLKLLKSIDISKAACIDDLRGRFLKDGAVTSAKQVININNCSIKLGIFPNPCKLAKLKPIFKKRFKNGSLQLHTYFVTTFDFKDI